MTKEFRFEASHRLPHHDGKCNRLHGHSWRLTVCVGGDRLASDGPKRGMLMDYGDITAVVKPIVDGLDHSHLNDTIDNPTSEAVAEHVFGLISGALPPCCRLVWVEIGETCTTCCRYSAG